MQAPLVAAGGMSLAACIAALITLPHMPPARVQQAAPQPASVAVDSVEPVAPVATGAPAATPAAERRAMVAAARRDPALLLMLAAAFLGACGAPVFAVRAFDLHRYSNRL